MSRLQMRHIAISHTQHRMRVRKRFAVSSGFFKDAPALELLLTGYFTRCDTFFLAAQLLEEASVSELLTNASLQNPQAVDGQTHYLGICGEMTLRGKQDYDEYQILLPDALMDLPKLSAYLLPHYHTPQPRFCYLCLNERFALVDTVFSLFGEPELPLMLEHCHIKRIAYVVLAFAVDCLPKEELDAAIAYYLDKAEKCPKNWEIYGILLMSEQHTSLCKLAVTQRDGSDM